MEQFFEFYKNMTEVHRPFIAFGWSHWIYLLLSIAFIVFMYRKYCHSNFATKMSIQKGVAFYLLCEEIIYVIWLCCVCKENLFLEAIPLQLCSMSSYAAFFTLFTDNKQLKFFCGLMGTFGAAIALAYPATINQLYPIFSYRSINFFMQHAALVLFGLLQFENRELFQTKYFIKNMGIVAGLFLFGHIFNIIFHTAFMFVEMPPTVYPIFLLYQLTGPYFFFITFISIFSLIQVLYYTLLKKLYFSRRDA